MNNSPINVYVIGVFDLFHRGHIELLRRSRLLGDRLIVAVNSDNLVAAYKRQPIYSEIDRLELVKSCRYVDEAFIIDDYDNKHILTTKKIKVVVHGDDWEYHSYLKQIRVTEDFLLENGIEIKLLPYTQGVSTSEILKKIREVEK